MSYNNFMLELMPSRKWMYRANDYARSLFAGGFADSYAKRVADNYDKPEKYDEIYENAFRMGYRLGSARYLIDIMNRRGFEEPPKLEQRLALYKSDAAFAKLLDVIVQADHVDDIMRSIDWEYSAYTPEDPVTERQDPDDTL